MSAFRLVFYFPMVGLINLFLYILKYPSLTTALADVSMLDIAVGHFGHLEVITASQLSYPFARELARIAYQTVKRCNGAIFGRTRPATPVTGTGLQPAADTSNINFSDDVSLAVRRPASVLSTDADFYRLITLDFLRSTWICLMSLDLAKSLVKET